MARNANNLEKMASIDAQLRLLAPGKVSEDDKLVEYDALLLDRFLDILQDLHGEEIRETVQECYELSAEYEGKNDPQKLEELGEVLTSLDPGDSIVIASSFSHMLNLANLAEEVQIAHRRRNKKKKGDFVDENNATTESDIEETLKRLVGRLKKTPEEVFDALKNQTVDLVLTAHPTQSVRRSLLQKHGRIRNCLAQLYAKDITPDDKQELDEALQREIQAAFRTDEIRRTPPTPQDEMRAGMSYFHETIWKGVPRFLRRVDTALKNIGINERVPYNAPLIQFSSWMGGDRDGNPRVTPEVTRDVCLLARMMAANMYYSQIEDLMFELSMWRCNDELRIRASELQRSSKRDAKHYIEFWKQVPPSEPYRVILGDVRDKLYNTRERSRLLLSNGTSDIPEEATFTDVEQFLEPLELCYRSLCSCGDRAVADGSLLDFLRQVSTFGLSLVRLDIRQESDRHTDVMTAITEHLGIGCYRDWPEQRRQEWLLSELRGKRPLFGPDLPKTAEIADVLDTFHVISELPSDNFGAYIISTEEESAAAMKGAGLAQLRAAGVERRWILPLAVGSFFSILLFFFTLSASTSAPFSIIPFSLAIPSSFGSGSPPVFVEDKLRAVAAESRSASRSLSSPPSPPRLAYLISGSVGDGEMLKRALLALYHPHNRYVVHLDLEATPRERLDLREFVTSHPVFAAVRNVIMITKANLITYRGPTMVANTLHAAAILLREGGEWDWFINLSASDYPLVTQDDLLHTMSYLPRDLNFIDHTSNIGWKEFQRAKPIIIDPGLYLSKKEDVFWITQRRSVPTAFKLFTGSAWMALSRAFVEYCVWGWENLPRAVLMYYANFISSPEGYFHTVVCNAEEFRNTTVNSDLHFITWDNPPKQHPHYLTVADLPRMAASNAPFARKFPHSDPVLDRIDAELLFRPPGSPTPGGWCAAAAGPNSSAAAACLAVGNATLLRPGPGALRLDRLFSSLLSPTNFRPRQCQ